MVQAVLLVTLLWLPQGNDWPTSSAVRVAGSILVLVGLGLVIVASMRLGRALTPNPAPNGRGALQVHGLYRFARHPIYSGVLLIVVGLVIPSANLWSLAVGIVTGVFFDYKARWEERRLALRFPDYEAYARRTGRFFPWRGRSGYGSAGE